MRTTTAELERLRKARERRLPIDKWPDWWIGVVLASLILSLASAPTLVLLAALVTLLEAPAWIGWPAVAFGAAYLWTVYDMLCGSGDW